MINIISMVSVVGVTIGTMALIIVLSVFNGFERLVVSLFDSFNPDLQISLKEGKVFQETEIPEALIREMPGVVNVAKVLEENALMRYREKQAIVTMKGVSEGYARMTGIDTMMVEGRFLLEKGDQNFTVLGYGIAYFLDASLQDYLQPIKVFVPSRTRTMGGGDLTQAFNQESIFPSGVFSIQQDFDITYALLPLRFVRNILEYHHEISSVEVKLQPGTDHLHLQRQIQKAVGERFEVKNRFQQQEMLYNIMKSEKWAIFLILTFILLLATFNVVGSLSMLILDKKKDIAILQSMGATNQLIRGIFLTEGMMISLIGAISGMILGGVICWLQQAYGLIKMGGPGSTFVVENYPVEMQPLDFMLVFITVLLIGYLAAWYPVHNIKKIKPSLVHLD